MKKLFTLSILYIVTFICYAQNEVIKVPLILQENLYLQTGDLVTTPIGQYGKNCISVIQMTIQILYGWLDIIQYNIILN